jgi:hypothetical protein
MPTIQGTFLKSKWTTSELLAKINLTQYDK